MNLPDLHRETSATERVTARLGRLRIVAVHQGGSWMATVYDRETVPCTMLGFGYGADEHAAIAAALLRVRDLARGIDDALAKLG